MRLKENNEWYISIISKLQSTPPPDGTRKEASIRVVCYATFKACKLNRIWIFLSQFRNWKLNNQNFKRLDLKLTYVLWWSALARSLRKLCRERQNDATLDTKHGKLQKNAGNCTIMLQNAGLFFVTKAVTQCSAHSCNAWAQCLRLYTRKVIATYVRHTHIRAHIADKHCNR